MYNKYMASIQFGKGRKKPYRVFWCDIQTGKSRNKSFTRRKDAQVFRESLRSSENIVVQADPNKTVNDALDRWYTLSTTIGRGGREPVERSTARKYDLHRSIISSYIGATKQSELDTKVCEDFRDQLLTDYSRPYAKKILTSFKSAISQSVNDKIIPSNPASQVFILISSRQKNANKVEIPELREIHTLTKAIDRLMISSNETIRNAWSRYGPMFYTELYSGMRPTEIRGLPWRDVDWGRGGIQVTQDADEFHVIGALKSGAAYRFIPMPDFVMQMLKAWENLCPNGKDNLAFPNWIGNVESHGNITNRGWYPLCKHAGLVTVNDRGQTVAKYPLNCLRHVKASLEIQLGRSPKKIQEIMGHEDIKMTLDIYGHLFRDQDLQHDPNDAYKLIKSIAQILPKQNQVIDIKSKNPIE
jgi:integrase